jgi:hypothetical protein
MEARQKFARSAMGGFREEGMGGERGQHKKRQQDEPTGGSEARGQQRALEMQY